MVDTYKKEAEVECTVDNLAKDFDCGLSKVGLLPEDLLKDILTRMVKFVNNID